MFVYLLSFLVVHHWHQRLCVCNNNITQHLNGKLLFLYLILLHVASTCMYLYTGSKNQAQCHLAYKTGSIFRFPSGAGERCLRSCQFVLYECFHRREVQAFRLIFSYCQSACIHTGIHFLLAWMTMDLLSKRESQDRPTAHLYFFHLTFLVFHLFPVVLSSTAVFRL